MVIAYSTTPLSVGKDFAILRIAQEMSGNLIKAYNGNISSPERTTLSVTETLINSVTFMTKGNVSFENEVTVFG